VTSISDAKTVFHSALSKAILEALSFKVGS